MKTTLGLALFAFSSMLMLAERAEATTTCYVCNSNDNDNCGEDDFNSVTNILNVETGCEQCQKTVVGLFGSNALVTRSCEETCVPVNTGVGTLTACCDSLLCNGASFVRPVAGVVMATLATVALLVVF